jgi:hypothetical protein
MKLLSSHSNLTLFLTCPELPCKCHDHSIFFTKTEKISHFSEILWHKELWRVWDITPVKYLRTLFSHFIMATGCSAASFLTPT